MKNHEKSSIWPKLATFRANYTFREWTFRKKVAKSGSFREKPSKMIDLTRTGTFSSNYHLSRFGWTFRLPWKKVAKSGSMNFSWKTWKIIKNHRFNENWQLFEQTITFRAFHELFGESCKKWLISWKTMKNYRFGQTWERFEQTITFRGLDELFGKKLQKVAHLVKNHEKSSIWTKLATFQANYHASMKFLDRSLKKWLISWKTTKNHRFGQNWQLFEQTITFRGFDELFGKKLQKVAHFVKNHQKWSI